MDLSAPPLQKSRKKLEKMGELKFLNIPASGGRRGAGHKGGLELGNGT